MYEFLEGIVVDIQPDHVVLKVNGVGFFINVADPYHFQENETDVVRIYVYQSVTENAILLYGFPEAEDKRLFEKLITVPGIGPKGALAILAGNDRDGLIAAVRNEDAKFLQKFPGVGKKTASQIILALKDKLSEFAAARITVSQKGEGNNPKLNDALMALKSLGYSDNQVDNVKAELMKNDKLSTDQYISLGLKLLL